MTIEIPLPPVDCKPNTHKHWRAKSRAISQYREEALIACKEQAERQFSGPVEVSHEWFMGKDPKEALRGYTKRYRPLDVGNAIAALKAAIDGCVDSKLLIGDSHRQLEWGKCVLNRSAKEHKGRCCVVLTFKEIE